MEALLEISSAVIRVLPDNATYGDVFDFALFVIGDEDTAILKGLRIDDRRFTVHHKRAIMRCLKKAGFARVSWDRYRKTATGHEKRKFTLDLNACDFSASHLMLGERDRAAAVAA